jgi:pilus assembly protein CpaF
MASGFTAAKLWHFHFMQFVSALQNLLDDANITDIVINGVRTVLARSSGRWFSTETIFSEPRELQDFALDLAESANQTLNFKEPFASFVAGGWRISAVLSFGICSETNLTYRRVSGVEGASSPDQLFTDQRSGDLLTKITHHMDARQSVLIAGSAGSGKTTLLRALLRRYPAERIITIEDVDELNVGLPNAVGLLSREPNAEGVGAVSLSSLLSYALRMSPDRIALGEVRSVELVAMLDALNTGHSGAGATIHANSLEDVASRIEALGLRAGLPLPVIARLAESALGLVVFVSAIGGYKIEAVGVPKATSSGLQVIPLG